MKVLEERKAKGIPEIAGKEAMTLKDTSDKYEQGRKVLETLTKTPQAKPAPGFGKFAPLMADIFESDVLTYQQRELATISALAAMAGVEPQLQAHLTMGRNTGFRESQT